MRRPSHAPCRERPREAKKETTGELRERLKAEEIAAADAALAKGSKSGRHDRGGGRK